MFAKPKDKNSFFLMQPNPIMIAPYPIYATAPLINFYFDFEIDFDPFL